MYEQHTDEGYRRFYYYLHKIVDKAIGRVLDALDNSGMADDTIVIFTSDHGDLVGAHGGMKQKWYNAFDESIRVPLIVKGPGVVVTSGGVNLPTSHVDLIPTLMGLAGIDSERAAEGVAEHHDEAQPLPGRDLSGIIFGKESAETLTSPVYFMTEDDVSRGQSQLNMFSGKPYDAVAGPICIESVVAALPTGADGGDELWKLNHYFERMDEWNAAHGMPKNPFAGTPADAEFELHNLTKDPEERLNHVVDAKDTMSKMQSVLDDQRDMKRLVPLHRNPVG
jgi:arylsulfatase A-like enzyme